MRTTFKNKIKPNTIPSAWAEYLSLQSISILCLASLQAASWSLVCCRVRANVSCTCSQPSVPRPVSFHPNNSETLHLRDKLDLLEQLLLCEVLHEIVVDPPLPVGQTVPSDVQRALRCLQGETNSSRTSSYVSSMAIILFIAFPPAARTPACVSPRREARSPPSCLG